MKKFLILLCFVLMTSQVSVLSIAQESDDGAQLLRVPYTSAVTEEGREFFLYLPNGYDPESDQEWPVLLFLHGDGERGDNLEDLEQFFDDFDFDFQTPQDQESDSGNSF